MPVEILGAKITLLCFDLQSNYKFKVSIRARNDVNDLKKAIKEVCEYNFPPRFLTLWRVDTDQVVSEDMLNDKLVDTAQKIGETFHDVAEGKIRVAVKAPDTGELRKFVNAI
jgi:hypothetical protein